MVMSTTADAPPTANDSVEPAATGSPAAQKGGVIAETITLTDTGERKQMFGLEARHIKTVAARKPGAGSCDPKATLVETDGWYADLPLQTSCPLIPAAAPPPPVAQSCTDRVETQQTGTAALGFALSTAITTTVDDGKEKEVTTMAVTVTDLQMTSLPAALFDVPQGYTEVKNYQELLPSSASDGGGLADALFGSLANGTSSVAPKLPGVIRIGVADPDNKSGRTLPTSRLRGGLIASLSKVPFEALPLTGAMPSDLDRDAAAKSCDYVLVADIAELKTSKPGKVGGMLRRASGDPGASSEVHDARVDYRLFAVGDETSPKISSSAKASSGGGFGVGSALRVAAFAGSMYMTMGMGTGSVMSLLGPGASFGRLGGLSGGGLSGVMNPGMGAAMSMMGRAQTNAAGAGLGADSVGDQSAEKATQTVQEALSKAGKHIAEQLKAGKLPPGTM
jgi:hypothetical protein